MNSRGPLFLYMNKLFFIGLLFLAFSACKPTEQDIENEKLLIGKWITTEEVNSSIDTMFYEFSADNKGSSSLYGETNAFVWEIKRNYLNTVYKKSPSYYIGYDKYNSKGYYKILSLNDSVAEVVQLYYNGLEATRTLTKLK